MARAYAALGQKSEGIQYLQLAREAGEQIQNIEPEDKEIFFGDFESGPTIIRSLLALATMRLLGRWNWWLPGRPIPREQPEARQ